VLTCNPDFYPFVQRIVSFCPLPGTCIIVTGSSTCRKGLKNRTVCYVVGLSSLYGQEIILLCLGGGERDRVFAVFFCHLSREGNSGLHSTPSNYSRFYGIPARMSSYNTWNCIVEPPPKKSHTLICQPWFLIFKTYWNTLRLTSLPTPPAISIAAS